MPVKIGWNIGWNTEYSIEFYGILYSIENLLGFEVVFFSGARKPNDRRVTYSENDQTRVGDNNNYYSTIVRVNIIVF